LLENIMTPIEFQALVDQGYRRIPVLIETLADLDTPLGIYLKLANGRGSYLFESVIGGERFGRYSFIGIGATQCYVVQGQRVWVERQGQRLFEQEHADPLAWIDGHAQKERVAPLPASLRFAGGLVGYFSYDSVRYVERKLAASQNDDPLGLPDIQLFRSDELAIVDNVSGKLTLVVHAVIDEPAEALAAYARARHRLGELQQALRRNIDLPKNLGSSAPAPQVTSNFSKEAFISRVEACKRYIVEGDIFQVQISQRFTQPFTAAPIHLYRALRSINPSPYMYFLDLGNAHIVGASPEILVRRQDDTVTVRPIAGTRKRGATPERDRALEQELREDPKEIAEHVMLIDLGRNDVGRIANVGSVRVTETMVVERYSHVMHLVSHVDAQVPSNLTPMQVFRATFPAGTVTGTPKVRAMEIIDAMEPVRRGIYAGAVGYIGDHGNMDLAIAIRTGVIKDGLLHVQAAAGVVADSVPELEWLETNNKCRALLRAAEWVQAGLDGGADGDVGTAAPTATKVN
jgi:anthranilate synthase component I